MKNKKLLLLLIIIISLTNCKNKLKPVNKKNDEIIVAEITKVIDTDTRSAITEIDTNDFTFILDGEDDLIKNLEIGDILVDSSSDMAPNGYLRKIISIDEHNGEIIINTEQAKLGEAIPQGKIDFQTSALNKKGLKSYTLAKGVQFMDDEKLSKSTFNAFGFDFDKTVQTDNGKVKFSGYASLDMDFIFKFDWSFSTRFQLVEIDIFKTGLEINQVSNIKVEADAGAFVDKHISIATLSFTPWTFSVGIVPVVFVPSIELFIDLYGNISAEMSTSAGESYHGEVGVKYSTDDGWNGIGESDFETDFNAPVLTSGANFKAGVGPEVKILLYGIAGPILNIQGFCELDAEVVDGQNWNLDFYVGMEVNAGVEMNLLGFDDLRWTEEIFEKKLNLYSLDSEPFDNAINIKNPSSNSEIKVGNEINITTEIIGDDPDEVQFFIGDELKYTDSEAPFEYLWDTQSMSSGNYNISVKEIINNDEVASDQITIKLVTYGWEAIDLAEFGVPETAVIHKVIFRSDDFGWIFGKLTGRYYSTNDGFVLVTSDGGDSWELIETDLFSEVVALNNEKLYVRHGNFVKVSSSGGLKWSQDPIECCIGDPIECHPTFKFLVEGIAMNSNGELVAIGETNKAQGNNDFYIKRANTGDKQCIQGSWMNNDYYSVPGDFANIYIKDHFGIAYNIGRKDTESPIYLTSTDDGATWTEHDATFQNNVGRDTYGYNACFINKTIGWIVGGTSFFDDGYIAKTMDGGETFTKIKFQDIGIKTTGGTSASSVYFISEDEGYVGFSSTYFENDEHLPLEPKIYKTLDGGETWAPVQEILTRDGINDIFFLGSKVGWAVGNGTVVYKYSKE